MKGSNLLAFLGGAIVGGAIALLLAPQSGEKTREQIRDFVEDGIDDVKDFAGRTVSQAKHAVNKGAQEARHVINKGASVARGAVCREEKKAEKVLHEVEEAIE